MRARGYGGFDVGFACLYGVLGFGLAPSRSLGFQVVLGSITALLGLAGLALVVGGDGSRLGRVLGIAACVALLVFTIACLALLAASSAFLFGVYGAVGKGLGAITIGVGALVVELFGLLPLFQLRFHLRRPR